jgi:integrase
VSTTKPIHKRCPCNLPASAPACRKNHGSWYYRLRVKDPATGQVTHPRESGFPTREAAEQAYDELLEQVRKGGAPGRRRETFRTYATTWLDAKSHTEIRENTLRGYRSNVGTACQYFGAVPIGEVSKAHVQTMVSAMVDAGRSQRTVSLLLFVVRSVFAEALADGIISRNPAARVKATGQPARRREALTSLELATLREHISADRLAAVWELTLYGLRRSEVLALTWADIDLSTGVLSITRGVTSDDHGRRSAATPPKTERGRRELPLPAATVLALRALRDTQAREFGFEHVRTGYLACDESGTPYRPERWSDLWTALCREAGIRVLTLHSARHTAVTMLRANGVPDDVVSQWTGHDEVTMRRTYSHPDADAMASAGRVLSDVFGGKAAPMA